MFGLIFIINRNDILGHRLYRLAINTLIMYLLTQYIIFHPPYFKILYKNFCCKIAFYDKKFETLTKTICFFFGFAIDVAVIAKCVIKLKFFDTFLHSEYIFCENNNII